MKLGIVTYQIAADWDVATIIETCAKLGYGGAELRTTHAHGVESDLSAEQRQDIRKQFEDGGVEIAGLGSAFEYHSDDPGVVRENIDGTIEYAKLAADLGCPGVKVRPNGLQTEKGISVDQTLEQIGKSVRECAIAAADLGVQIRGGSSRARDAKAGVYAYDYGLGRSRQCLCVLELEFGRG